MPDGIRWVGLDVHARESTFAIFDQATGELATRRVVGRPHELLPWLRGVARPARMVYEAGPTGYGLARRALAEGIELGVCAPGKTERPPADRIKTDKRDAIRLARLLAAGELTLVTIPSVEREQLRDQVEAQLAQLALSAPCAHTIARLRCLRGIDTLSALGLCSEIGEWERFDHPDQLSSYLGIVPSEHTSGAQRRLGSITKAGSTHARRLLVEASYHYRRGPAVGEALERRQRGQAPEIIHISWKAQRRLNARWRQLKDIRRKPGGIVAIAIARELAAYCSEIATCPTALQPIPTPTTPKRLTNSR
jgi:transposase